jgi:hypothetical protein
MQTRPILHRKKALDFSWRQRPPHPQLLLAITLRATQITAISTKIVRIYAFFASMITTNAICVVPIYDCRETRFRFNEQAFSTINNLPVCTEDLEPDSLVSIAYTVNSFPYAQVAQTPKTDIAVLFNVLFVLFLGQLPEDSPRSESEWAGSWCQIVMLQYFIHVNKLVPRQRRSLKRV